MDFQKEFRYTFLTIICFIAVWIANPSMGLVVSEIMYRPTDANETLEFIELYNNRAVFEDITGFAFTKGISYEFESETIIEPKQYLVLARDPNALEAAYGISGVYGPYTGQLSNNAEQIELSNNNGEIIISFQYDDEMPWPVSPDGTGHSLILKKTGGDPDEASTWSPSTFINGSPGGPDAALTEPEEPIVVINELLANSNSPSSPDWIELYNPGPAAYDLSNTYLSDTRNNLLQYKIPDGTILESGEFWSVSKGTPPTGFPFGLAPSGETIYLTEATDDTTPESIRVLDAVRYEGVEPNITIGRYPDGSQYVDYLGTATYNGPNSKHSVSDIVINEIMYHHGARDELYEYIELYNQGLDAVSLKGWAFTDGISYEFNQEVELAPNSYLVVAKDPNLLESIYDNLTIGSNLFGPYSGNLNDHSERIRLAYPFEQTNPDNDGSEIYMITADEVTYYDGGQWPAWADGKGASLELIDPKSNNNTPYAWADSDESDKTTWQQFSFTINNNDPNYTHDRVNVFELLLLNSGELLIDDLELYINGINCLMNNNFESGEFGWRFLGNHIRSFTTTDDCHSGSQSLHMIATGHGDPGANRINQSIADVTADTVTFSGWARWLRGSRCLLLRTSRERSPVQPPRPAYAFELDMPLNLGTPGQQNTAYLSNRGPDILEVQHSPTLPGENEPITITARVTDNDDTVQATLYYRSEGDEYFINTPMVDDGSGDDIIAGDGLFTATIPGAPAGTMRAFYIEASDGFASTRFPTLLPPTADVPERTCLVRVGDTLPNTEFATYRIWLSDDVIDTFTSRPNLSNELLDCTFVYNNTDVFYNARIRYRGSPFIRSGSGRDPRNRYAYRIDFNPDQRFRGREEINLDNTEGGNRGPLQERASYWFYQQMGLEFSMQEFIRPIINGNSHNNYEDVQKIDGDYISRWFHNDDNGYIHKIDDYFEYSAGGTSSRNLDEGLKYDSAHPLLKETYRWGFEKRSHRENDNWDHLYTLAMALNTPSDDPDYEQIIESVVDPEHFTRVLAVRHALGDWDSYGYRRGKNNYFYYAPTEDKWYLLPWDIDFTLGSGDNPDTSLFSIASNKFPEVDQFLTYPKYKEMYFQAYRDLVNGPLKTSYGTSDPPTAFDRFLDDAADALIADGGGSGRRDGIKQFVRDRRTYILTQIPTIAFEITTNNGDPFCTTESEIAIQGTAPPEVSGILVNNVLKPVEFQGYHNFELSVQLEMGVNFIFLQGLDDTGIPLPNLTDTVIIFRVPVSEITSITPNPVCSNDIIDLTIHGTGFFPGYKVSITLTKATDEIGFDALYVQNNQAFDRIDAATLLLDDDEINIEETINTVHSWINLSNPPGQGEFVNDEQNFAPPFDIDGTNFAVRFTGYIYAPSPGIRYFGVNSDDGFGLWIDGQLVGEYADSRDPQTTNVNQNITAGTMTFDFPSEGSYPLKLDFFENSGGETIEFFQTNSIGGEPKLINVDSELFVFRDDIKIEATNVVVVDENTITCQVDTTDAEAGTWTVIITPDCGDVTQTNPDNGLQINECEIE